ncbi:D-2-hydroxyacid dehydrogenase [Enterococcus sp. DIV0187]|uniref:D-2-hydroxyacid dehydrogenase n=1 Tax=Enterococcus sp. DIV0187 TaxID=2774644 RepID=UPI003F25549A
MKIVILDGYTLNPGDLSWEGFKEVGEVEVYDRTPEEMIEQRIGDAEIIITNKTPISKKIISNCSSIKYIGVLATGYDVIDVSAAHEKGIIVTNVPTYGTDTVAQFTFGMILEMCLNIGLHSDSVKEGEWQNNQDWCYWKKPLIELAGKTIGIVGFGRIGQNVGSIAKSFGMNVNFFDLNTIKGFENEGFTQKTLSELLETSDIVTLHCPLTEETSKIINGETLSLMKTTAFLVNCSRGGLVDEYALRDALNNNEIAGAAVDVVSTEPIKGDNPLLKAQNIIITPHIAWGTKEARARIMEMAKNNVISYINGNIQNEIK